MAFLHVTHPVELKISTLRAYENSAQNSNSLRSCIKSYLVGPAKSSISPYFRVCGFLKPLVFVGKVSPASPTGIEQKVEAIRTVWHSKLKARDLKTVAYKMGFSLDPELHEEMLKRSMPIEEILYALVTDIFLRFQEMFYPGEQLGFLLNVRKDKKIPEMRALVYPETATGKPIYLSDNVKVILPDHSIRRGDFKALIQEIVMDIGGKFMREEINGSRSSGDSYVGTGTQEMLLTRIAYFQSEAKLKLADPGIQPAFTAIWPLALSRRKELKLEDDDKLRSLLDEEYAKRLNQWKDLTIEEASEQKSKVERMIERQQLAILKMWEQHSSDHALELNSRIARVSIRKEAFRAILRQLGWSTLTYGGNIFCNHSDGWWNGRMHWDDDLGGAMRRIAMDVSAFVALTGHSKRFANQGVYQARQAGLHQIYDLLEIRSEKGREAVLQTRLRKISHAEKLRQKRLQLHLWEPVRLDCLGRLNGSQPEYLAQYLEWKEGSRLVPVLLTKTVELLEGEVRHDILKERERATSESTQATAHKYRANKGEAPLVEGEEEVRVVEPQRKTEQIKRVRTLSNQQSPLLILSAKMDVLDNAFTQHADAMKLMLKRPINDRIAHGSVSTWLDVADRNSFNGVTI